MKLFCPDALRALLRNLHLLAGQRQGRTRSKVLLCGFAPDELASRLSELEPSLAPHLSPQAWADLPRLAGANADAVIVSQVYHTLPSQAALLDVRKCLSDEDGALGLLWARRAPPRTAGSSAVSPPVSETSTVGVSTPPLGPKQSPIDWANGLGVTGFGFRPLKHRRFRFDIAPGAAADWLHAVADDRSAPRAATLGLVGDVGIDVHSFHSSCTPQPVPS